MTTYSEKMLASFEDNDYVEAEIHFEKALRFDDDEILESLGEELLRRGFLVEAKKIFTELLVRIPNYSALHLSLAEIAIEEDAIDEALEHLILIKKSDPAYAASLLVAADLYFTIDAPETSEVKLKEALQLLPEEPTIKFALGEFYLETSKFPEALFYYKELVDKGIEEFAQTRIPKQMGMAYSQIGEFDTAIALFENELDLNRSDDVLYALAILYLQLEERDKGIILLQELRLLSSTYVNIYIPLIGALLDEQRFEEADELIAEGLKENPYDVSLAYLAADYAFQYHRVDEAEEYLLGALKVEEDRELTLIKLSNFYLTQDRFEEVVELLEEAKELMHVEGHWSLAKAYYGTEQYEEALKQYEKAYDGLQDEPDFLKEYGLILREEGHIKKAHQLLKSYLVIMPEDMEIFDLLEE